jgi:hypothetical protein
LVSRALQPDDVSLDDPSTLDAMKRFVKNMPTWNRHLGELVA